MARSDGLYALLGVSRDDTTSAIRAAYRAKAIQLHPDRGGDPVAFNKVQEAYKVLSNTSKRKHYDETGRTEMTAEEILRKAMSQKTAEEPRAPAATKASAREPTPPPPAPEPVELPPNLRAAVEGLSADFVEVPPDCDKPVSHITVSERGGVKSLHKVSLYPSILDSKLLEGQVLVQMRAAPISMADLCQEDKYKPGDFYGSQGIGQVRLVGPKVDNVNVGDWVVPLLEVDEDGDLKEDSSPPGTCRTLAVVKACRCARLAFSADAVLSTGQMAIAKSLGAAYRMVEAYGRAVKEGETIIVNAANGIVGQCLVQILAVLKYRVIAVVREHEGVELVRRRLEGLGAAKAFIDDDSIRARIEELQIAAPSLAFDGVGGEATARIASSLSKTGDVVCYGLAGGSRKQVLPSGWGKKWRGAVHQFSFDEWLQEDLEKNSEKFNEMIGQASTLMQANRLIVDVREYPVKDFNTAMADAQRHCRMHAVVLSFPRLSEEGDSEEHSRPVAGTAQAKAAPVEPPKDWREAAKSKPHQTTTKKFLGSWDLAFLDWEEENEPRNEEAEALERDLFKPDPVVEEMRIQKYVDDALATPVAMELGAQKGDARAVFIWLPGAGEVPEEHGPWLTRLCSEHRNLRVLVLKPKLGFKWYDTSDHEAVKMGLNFGVLDDMDRNPDGDPNKSVGTPVFPPLSRPEIEALQQVEGAAIGLARRVVIEERAAMSQSGNVGIGQLPKPVVKPEFFFGGFGQGGAVAMYAAVCLAPEVVKGVAFCHSGIPVASMLGKRMTEKTQYSTSLYAVYDRADKEVPIQYPETIFRMFKQLKCDVKLEWLYAGDGHNFYDDAAAKVANCVKECLKETLSKRGGGVIPPDAVAFEGPGQPGQQGQPFVQVSAAERFLRMRMR